MFIEHSLKARGSEELFDLVKVIGWLGGEIEEETGYEVLEKVVLWIEEEGGVFAVLRKYYKHLILSQSVDCLKEQQKYLQNIISDCNILYKE